MYNSLTGTLWPEVTLNPKEPETQAPKAQTLNHGLECLVS